MWRSVGRCLEYGEYTNLVRQIRKGEAEQLGDRGGLYRVALRDGTLIKVVVRTWSGKRTGSRVRNYDLLRVVHPEPVNSFSQTETPPVPPPMPEPSPSSSIASAPPPELPAALPLPPSSPAPPVLRASTLTLGTKAGSAAELLAERLRPAPLPPRTDKPIVPKKKQARR